MAESLKSALVMERDHISGNERGGRGLVGIFSKQRRISPPRPLVHMLGVRVRLAKRLGDSFEDLSECF